MSALIYRDRKVRLNQTFCWHHQRKRFLHAVFEYEYAVPVWCPYLVKAIHALESVQRRASRLALNQHKREMPYVDPCKLLKWPSLSDRRNYLSLIECYKFVFGYYHLNFYDFFEFSKVGSTRTNHPFKLYVISARLAGYK